MQQKLDLKRWQSRVKKLRMILKREKAKRRKKRRARRMRSQKRKISI